MEAQDRSGCSSALARFAGDSLQEFAIGDLTRNVRRRLRGGVLRRRSGHAERRPTASASAQRRPPSARARRRRSAVRAGARVPGLRCCGVARRRKAPTGTSLAVPLVVQASDWAKLHQFSVGTCCPCAAFVHRRPERRKACGNVCVGWPAGAIMSAAPWSSGQESPAGGLSLEHFASTSLGK